MFYFSYFENFKYNKKNIVLHILNYIGYESKIIVCNFVLYFFIFGGTFFCFDNRNCNTKVFANQNTNGRNFLLKEAQLSHEFARSLKYFFS